MPAILSHSCRATKETRLWDDGQAASKQLEQEKMPGQVHETESSIDTDNTDAQRKGHATHHQGVDSMIGFGDFSNMDASSKRDRVRQGIVLQEDKIRSILSGMKERMSTVDKENESETDIESHSI
jgi:hypothetical protein